MQNLQALIDQKTQEIIKLLNSCATTSPLSQKEKETNWQAAYTLAQQVEELRLKLSTKE